MATDQREALFHSSLGSDKIHCGEITGLEEISRNYTYWVQILRLSKEGPIAPDDLLGKNVTVELKDTDAAPRFFNGWVTHFRRSGSDGRYDEYNLELRPWLWYLTLSNDCKIYPPGKTAVEIIKLIFGKYSSQQIDDRLTETYRKREFCVQYRESDFDFVSRLMEDEGIYYFFEHSKGQHKLVLCDAASAHKPLRDGSLGWSDAQKTGQLDQNVVTSWERQRSVRSLKYTHRDFDSGSPTTSLETTATRTPATKHPSPGDLEVYDYPGEYVDPHPDTPNTSAEKKEGERLAKLRVGAYEAHHDVTGVKTPCRGVFAGASFTLKDHPEKSENGEFLIIKTEFWFYFGSYESADRKKWGFNSENLVVPKKVPYLPYSITKRPLIAGPQTAIVVGPSGDELHTDKYGRVKVQFHWDRVGKNDDKSSCWVRVSHPWASKQFGMIALPRIGDEVVVEFLEGNPDRPLITGRVYNGDNMPPYELPAQATVSGIKTHSSKEGGATNFNELRFDDKKGSEYVFMQAEKDYIRNVKMDAFDKIGQHNQLEIVKNNTVKIGEAFGLTVGKNASAEIGGDASAKITGDLNLATDAALNVKTGAAVDFKGGAAITITAGAGFDVNATADVKITAGGAMQIKATSGLTIDGGLNISIKAGAGWITLGPDGVAIGGPMVKINSGGTGKSAAAAKKANPTAPKKPAAVVEKKDPLAK